MSISTSPSPVAAPELTDQREEVELLPSVNDHYGGVMVEMKTPMDSSAFVSSLRASISYWRKQGIKGVWIKLPINLSNLVQPAVEEGFWYHHAEPSYLMLVYWIPDTKHTIPANASHRVGVGGFVMNDKREVLVVQENSGKLHGSGVWKIPTGVVDQGEDIYAAAVREVKEETGILLHCRLTPSLLKYLHSGRTTCHSLGSQIYSLYACYAPSPLTFRSKNQKLRQRSGCLLRNMLHNLLFRNMMC
ncbi:nudix hydrolase 2 isoform X2 [Elaeis guineensis]|uniref:Nudix hydrolase 2 isoform X3 n=1 Tax=Elaeis guineensis var. tenera TaxID=51953 RepID=A0A6J0PSN1_ELAGV|nr:nudix hydrolase 2 isoform X3 [Elaeis guineensis]